MKFARLAERIARGLRVLSAQKRPHGLLGPAYLWPGADPRIPLHRRFWWHSGARWPRPLWLTLEIWLWLRWVLVHALPASWRATRRVGRVVEAEEGISQITQARRVLQLALLWCIPPWDSYRFKLYRDPAKALDYVYDGEVQAYHAWRSEALGLTPASLRLLQDKARFAELMMEHGVPIVSTLAHVARNSTDLTPLLECLHSQPRVFCKMNSGNQGRGAFAAWCSEEGMAGRRFTGQSLTDATAVEAAWRALLQLDDALIQPCLENHPDLAPLGCNADVITVRVISQWDDGGEGLPPTRHSCLSATLEVPAGVSAKGHVYYAILSIQAETGELGEAIRAMTPESEVRAALDRVTITASTLPALPGWRGLVEASYRAHGVFPDIRAIAWDWVITPDGPVLLEGNSGWGLANPQLLGGGGRLAG